MSTPSSLINSTSTIFTLDIYKQLFKPQASERELVRVGRIACIVAAFAALIWAPMVGKYKLIFDYFQSFVAYIAAPAGAIFLLGVFWRRATHKAALNALWLGLSFCLLIEFFKKWSPDYTLPLMHLRLDQVSFVYISFAGWILSMMIMVVVSLFDETPIYQEIKDLLWNRSALREPLAAASARTWYRNLWFWYAVFAASWVIVIVRFL